MKTNFHKQIKKLFLTLALALAFTSAMMAQTTYVITNGTGFTFNCPTVGLTNSSMTALLSTIRVHANGANCFIQCGSGGGTLSLSDGNRLEFDNSVTPKWGTVTLTGKVQNSGINVDIVYMTNGASITSVADITNTSGRAIFNTGTGTVTVTGGTVSTSSENAIYSQGPVDVNSGTVKATTGVAICLSSLAVTNIPAVSISGNALVTSGNTKAAEGTILVDGYCNVNISGGTVSNTSSTGRAINCNGWGNKLTISGGTISSGSGSFAINHTNGANITINGGSISGGVALNTTGASKIYISGSAKLTGSALGLEYGTIMVSNERGEIRMTGGEVSHTGVPTAFANVGNAILFTNNGYMEISGGKVTANGNVGIRFNDLKDGGLAISGSAAISSTCGYSDCAAIVLNGTTTNPWFFMMDGGTITNPSGKGIINKKSGTASISGGTITTRNESFINEGNAGIMISGGTLTSTAYGCFTNYGTGDIDIYGNSKIDGTIGPCIINMKNGKISISGDAVVTTASPQVDVIYGSAIFLGNVSSATTDRLSISGNAKVSNTGTSGARYAIYNASAGAVIFNCTFDQTITGVLGGTSGSGDYVKTGNSQLTLSGAHPAENRFSHQKGRLVFTGSWAGSFSLAKDAILQVNGNMTVAKTLELAGGEIGFILAASPASRISATGACSVSGVNKIIIVDAPLPNGQVLISAASGLGNASQFSVTPDSYALNASGTQLTLIANSSPVCEIVETGVKYNNLSAAISAGHGKTIRLLDNINHGDISLDYFILSFDLNGKTLNIEGCNEVINGSEIKIKNGGQFNITSQGAGLSGGSKLTVTNVSGELGITANTSSEATVQGNVNTVRTSLVAGSGSSAGGKITALGNVTTTGGAGNFGAIAANGGQITIDGKLTVGAGASYIKVGTAVKTAADGVADPAKPGYLKYSDGTSTVWVKGEPPVTAVNWSGLTANGTNGSVTTTALTLTFDKDPTALTAANITVTGATKGTLTGTGTTRTLNISNITVANGANVTVAIANPTGFTITPSSRTVAVYLAPAVVYVTGITVTGAGGATTITTSGGTLQMSAAITPTNATNKEVTWTVAPASGVATINTSGLLTATGNGTVTVRATAKDGSGVYGERQITVSNNTAIEVVEQQVLKAWTQDGMLYVSGLTLGKAWSVYSISGQLIHQAVAKTDEANIPLAAQGIYIVASGEYRVKLIAR